MSRDPTLLHLESMPQPSLIRRHVRVHSIGDLEIIERGAVATDAEFATRTIAD